KPGVRLIRYGCDQYFSRLKKQQRKPPLPKTPTKRPYPEWLRPYFFGSPYRQMQGTDPNCANYRGPQSKRLRYPARLEKFRQERDNDNDLDNYLDDDLSFDDLDK